MKVNTQLEIHADAEKIWDSLIDFDKYPSWNPMFPSVEGDATQDGTLTVQMRVAGKGDSTLKSVVTGIIRPKYFGWVWNHFMGAWWLNHEHVFRMRESAPGKTVFYQEAYLSGVRLRFGRKDIQYELRVSMERMNDALKEEVEKATS